MKERQLITWWLAKVFLCWYAWYAI